MDCDACARDVPIDMFIASNLASEFLMTGDDDFEEVEPGDEPATDSDGDYEEV